MGRMIVGCLLILGFFTVGCTATNSTTRSTFDLSRLSKAEIEAYNANPENRDKIVCERYKPVGSNIPKTECYKVSKIEDRQSQDQQALKEIQMNTRPIPSK